MIALSLSAVAAAAGAADRAPTPSIFAPVSTPAFAIRDVGFFVLGITAVIFVIVAGLAAYTIVRATATAAPRPDPSRRRSTAARRSSWRGRWCRS